MNGRIIALEQAGCAGPSVVSDAEEWAVMAPLEE